MTDTILYNLILNIMKRENEIGIHVYRIVMRFSFILLSIGHIHFLVLHILSGPANNPPPPLPTTNSPIVGMILFCCYATLTEITHRSDITILFIYLFSMMMNTKLTLCVSSFCRSSLSL